MAMLWSFLIIYFWMEVLLTPFRLKINFWTLNWDLTRPFCAKENLDQKSSLCALLKESDPMRLFLKIKQVNKFILIPFMLIGNRSNQEVKNWLLVLGVILTNIAFHSEF